MRVENNRGSGTSHRTMRLVKQFRDGGANSLLSSLLAILSLSNTGGVKIDIPPQQKLVTSIVTCTRVRESFPCVSIVVASPEFRNVGQKKGRQKKAKDTRFFWLINLRVSYFFAGFMVLLPLVLTHWVHPPRACLVHCN